MRVRFSFLLLALALVAAGCGEDKIETGPSETSSDNLSVSRSPLPETDALESNCHALDWPMPDSFEAATGGSDDDELGTSAWPHAVVNEMRDSDVVIFDATESYDLDGSIELVEWYVGDADEALMGVAIECRLEGDDVLSVTAIVTDNDDRQGFGGGIAVAGQPMRSAPWCRGGQSLAATPAWGAIFERALSSMHIMSLLADPGRGGRFEMRRPMGVAEGTYWSTEGGFRTSLDVDTALVETELERLLDIVVTDELRGLYEQCAVAVDFQMNVLSIVDFDAPTLAWYAGLNSPSDVEACFDSIEHLLMSASDYLESVGVEFEREESWAADDPDSTEAWTLEHSLMGQALSEPFVEANQECGSDLSIRPGRRFRFERSLGGPHQRLRVWSEQDHDNYDSQRELILELTVTEDSSIDQPDRFNPAPWSWVADYVAAIDACGGLPAVYSNFMASDSWTEPGDAYYSPGPLDEKYRCVGDQS